jgi:hypothetical protein
MPFVLCIVDDDVTDPAKVLAALAEAGTFTQMGDGWVVTSPDDDAAARARSKAAARARRYRAAHADRDASVTVERDDRDASVTVEQAKLQENSGTTKGNPLTGFPFSSDPERDDRDDDDRDDRDGRDGRDGTLRLTPQYAADGTALSNQPWRMEPLTPDEREAAQAKVRELRDELHAARKGDA